MEKGIAAVASLPRNDTMEKGITAVVSLPRNDGMEKGIAAVVSLPRNDGMEKGIAAVASLRLASPNSKTERKDDKCTGEQLCKFFTQFSFLRAVSFAFTKEK